MPVEFFDEEQVAAHRRFDGVGSTAELARFFLPEDADPKLMDVAGRRFSAGLGTRGRGVGDDAQVGAGDAEHVASELDVTDEIAA